MHFAPKARAQRTPAATRLADMQKVGWIGLVAFLVAAAGCDWVTSSGPETMRLRLEGDVSTMTVITSTRFLANPRANGRLDATVLEGDTLEVSLPFERTYDISDSQRFLARVPDVREDQGLRLRGWLDGELRYDQRTDTIPADSTLQVLYIFGSNRAPGNGDRL